MIIKSNEQLETVRHVEHSTWGGTSYILSISYFCPLLPDVQ